MPSGIKAVLSLTALLLQRRRGQDLGAGEPQVLILVVSWLICRDWRSAWNTDEWDFTVSYSVLPVICPPGSGLVKQCLRLEWCWTTSTYGLAAQCASELQLLWSVFPNWAMGAANRNYWKQDMEVCCQDSQYEVRNRVSGISHAQVETNIKALLVLMKGEFSPGAVTCKTSQMKK